MLAKVNIDDDKTFEVVDANEIPEDWFSDRKFKEVYNQENAKVVEKELLLVITTYILS